MATFMLKCISCGKSHFNTDGHIRCNQCIKKLGRIVESVDLRAVIKTGPSEVELLKQQMLEMAEQMKLLKLNSEKDPVPPKVEELPKKK